MRAELSTLKWADTGRWTDCEHRLVGGHTWAEAGAAAGGRGAVDTEQWRGGTIGRQRSVGQAAPGLVAAWWQPGTAQLAGWQRRQRPGSAAD
ncbi:hypothetical protein Pmani_013510 [Petrolisthes manimaculis]|uniref:Uncharacterized protein n=1 Tax=Petrolisthes manimaculis TaxID=1843537 RepID=A0AAE1UC38_9EUCA|nr:hypothetical protein Pmani_035497 [Petrolisthes manimaculis]KAK4315261.1 hypothetical protein Pmani_013510 [Petrolisthes manimaculis]